MKVLLLTHNPTSTDNNMGKTFLSLFSGFEKTEMCQLYVYPTVPDVDFCNSYYRITDARVLLSLLNFKSPGEEITSEMISERISQKDVPAQQSQPGNSSAAKRLIRDMVWKMSRWYSRDLRVWLNREEPDCIFLAPGYAKFIYDIALKISSARNIPIVTYICDDYYFVKKPRGFLGKLQLRLLQKKTDCLISHTSRLVAISEEIRSIYEARFGVASELIMTGGKGAGGKKLKERTPNRLSYFGNLGANRERSLADIARVLDEINQENKSGFTLDIYTGTSDAQILSVLEGFGCIRLHGFVSGDEFDRAMSDSDMLVHVEGFDEASIDLVKHSVSTKIADSLASGIPLFAYAPANVASVAHLIRGDCAVTATSVDELRRKLELVLFDGTERERIVANALKTAAEYHDRERNSRKLKDIFEGVL